MKQATKQWISSMDVQDRRVSQQDAGYDPLGMTGDKGCANCRWFVEPNGCCIVQGPINPTGLSNYWLAEVPAEQATDTTVESDAEDMMDMGMSELHAEDRADWSTAYKNNLPDSAFLYIEPGGKKDADGKTTPRSLRHFPVKDANGKVDEAHVRDALGRIPQSNVADAAKNAALARVHAMAKSLGIEVAAGNKSLSDNVKDMFAKFVRSVRSGDGDPVFGLREVNGRTRFICTFTNCTKDSEKTIFATAAHRDYERWVDHTGQYPELWFWHTPGTRLGVADWIAESNGVQYASGLIDEGQELRAYELAGSKDLAMSHGYVYAEERDGVYHKYRSYEISVLPRKYAANQFTAFDLLGEESMGFSQAKRDSLKQLAGYTDEQVADLEKGSEKFIEYAKTLGVEMKDNEQASTDANAVLDLRLDRIEQVLGKMVESIQAVDAKAVEAGEKAVAATKSLDDAVADHMTAQISKLPQGSKATESDSNVVEQKQAQTDLAWFDNVWKTLDNVAIGG